MIWNVVLEAQKIAKAKTPLTGCRVLVFGIVMVGAPLPVLFLSSHSLPGAQSPGGRLSSSEQATEVGWNAWPAGQILREADPCTQT